MVSVTIKKITKVPSTVLLPIPTVLVTSVGKNSKPNIITIAWTGVMNSEPPVVYVSVRPIGRHSYGLIKESGEYVINIPTAAQARLVDYCGTISGSEVDKFKETGFTPVPATHVRAPLIAECPVNLECKVKQVVPLGSHDVFIADVLAVHYNEDVLDEKGRPDPDKIKPYGYCLNEYRQMAGKLGSFGYSKKA
ncbi:MAG: Flavoredoxin [Pelotomaculum sp. PtaB.Bin013]|uniref:Flavin reductase family protein n=1 Tax=Pelotomaculum isophthalicicum JI TaxID=947010 RepID=A0A9X4H1Z4_9FIRM|nr:flavin reductase family protein [Pelotomaculum isophthalicicum]MDF9408475.1 flavin reductase family protein [Pelotomaculum isophthalicicum JI]OPX89735.1 MAG: Flavoredoxin [Pelotomaculum sp. PtaB.Bin013]